MPRYRTKPVEIENSTATGSTGCRLRFGSGTLGEGLTDSQRAMRAWSNAELALLLRQRAGSGHEPFIIEAARRLEVLAMARGECECVMIDRPEIRFAKYNQTLAATPPEEATALPVQIIEIGGFAPGEHRAVDRFGTVVIVKRVERGRP